MDLNCQAALVIEAIQENNWNIDALSLGVSSEAGRGRGV